MKIEAWSIGKTSEPYLETGLAIFEKRLKNYLPFTWLVFPDLKKRSADPQQIRKDEALFLLSKLQPDDMLVLLDEKGQQLSSLEMAQWFERRLGASRRRLVFLIGGAYGFAPELYSRANELLSLSKLTFSHQMVRLFFLEQLYRTMTILRNEPYHNE